MVTLLRAEWGLRELEAARSGKVRGRASSKLFGRRGTVCTGSSALEEQLALADVARERCRSLEFFTSFVEAGVSPKQILRAMTVDAARLMGMEKERGAIAPGFAADLVATADNPLEKIDAVRHVAFVMKDGRIVKNE